MEARPDDPLGVEQHLLGLIGLRLCCQIEGASIGHSVSCELAVASLILSLHEINASLAQDHT